MRRLALTLLFAVACSNAAAPAAAPTTSPPAPTPTTPAPPVPTTLSPSPTAKAALRYAFPVARCHVSYVHGHHDYPATDVMAAKGCAFVAPVAGVVDEVSFVDRWNGSTNRGNDRGGLSVSIAGDDGVRYYGSHLSAIATGIKPGVRVKTGTRLGSVGNTGSARGIATHLHFGISWPTRDGVWWVRRGVADPYPYLRAWQRGADLSPAAAVRALRRSAGTDTPRCKALC